MGNEVRDRRRFIEHAQRDGVRFEGDRAAYLRRLKTEALAGNEWARAAYQREMRGEGEVARDEARTAEMQAEANDAAARCVDVAADVATFGAHRNLQAMGERAMAGDADATLDELGAAALKVVGSAALGSGVAFRAAAQGARVARSVGVGMQRAAIRAGEAITRPGRVASVVRELEVARPPAPILEPAAPAPLPEPAPPAEIPAPHRPALSGVQRYQVTGHDPGRAEWLENMARLRKMARGG